MNPVTFLSIATDKIILTFQSAVEKQRNKKSLRIFCRDPYFPNISILEWKKNVLFVVLNFIFHDVNKIMKIVSTYKYVIHNQNIIFRKNSWSDYGILFKPKVKLFTMLAGLPSGTLDL